MSANQVVERISEGIVGFVVRMRGDGGFGIDAEFGADGKDLVEVVVDHFASIRLG